MSHDTMKHRRLQELGHSDFEIVDGQPDIRGWDVKTTDGTTVGEVDELILDAQARKVRYMVVDLDNDALGLDEDRHVLIPIGLAQLHEKDDDVILSNITLAQLSQLPEYDEDNLNPEAERAICSVLGRGNTGTIVNSDVQNDDFYQHEQFNEGALSQRRLPQNATGIDNNMEETRSRWVRERNTSLDNEGDGGMYSGITGNESRSLNRENMYHEEEMPEEMLSPVSNPRRDTDVSRDDQADNADDIAREIERRHRQRDMDNDRSSL